MTKPVSVKRKFTAYHGSRDRKARFVKEQRAHLKADRFMKGNMGEFQFDHDNMTGDDKLRPGSFRGCGIACSVYSIKRLKRERILPKSMWDDETFYDHKLVANYLGISDDLAHAFENVFESLHRGDASKFAVDFALALKPGSQPDFNLDHFYDDLHGKSEAKRDHLLKCLRQAKSIIEVR